METEGETRAARKDREIIQAARRAFIDGGYDGTSMEEIATKAGASKQTVYKHFVDKETLFGEVVLSTAGQANDPVEMVTALLSETVFLQGGIQELGRRLVVILMDEDILKLRRLIIANADRMPQLGRTWYERGFERMIGSIATCFRTLTARGLMTAGDPVLAANHFLGMLLWIPSNEAMFTGNTHPRSKAELESHADASVEAFLLAYGPRKP
jgi:TetR/AcrR family transcriptional repressor of mexJK operon